MSEPDPATPNSIPHSEAALPLDELELTPQWVKAPTPSYRDHSGGERADKKHNRGFRDREEHRPLRPKERQRKPQDGRIREARARPPHPPPQHEAVVPIEISFIAEEKGFSAMLATMKESRRAYAVFDLAKLVLNKPERHLVKLRCRPAASGVRPPLFLVPPTENVFFSQEAALRSIFRHHPELLFRETKTSIDPPKGNFVFVNRCGFTGEVLGPPNYHEYQAKLVRHHQLRLAHVPFEQFKARLQTVRDPEAIKAWLKSMSVKAEYECVLDAEPKKFGNREELEKHVRDNHLDKLVTSATELSITGSASRKLEDGTILEAVRDAWLAERRFPLNTAHGMQSRLRHEGFHFFKHRKGITYITAVKPKRLQTGQTLTEHVQKIIAFIRTHERCTRKELFAELRPSANAPDVTPSASEEQLLADLHWLIQDGYVVEFSDGRLCVMEEKAPKPQSAAATASATPSQPPLPAASQPVEAQ
jgi:hypothetical protein